MCVLARVYACMCTRASVSHEPRVHTFGQCRLVRRKRDHVLVCVCAGRLVLLALILKHRSLESRNANEKRESQPISPILDLNRHPQTTENTHRTLGTDQRKGKGTPTVQQVLNTTCSHISAVRMKQSREKHTATLALRNTITESCAA